MIRFLNIKIYGCFHFRVTYIIKNWKSLHFEQAGIGEINCCISVLDKIVIKIDIKKKF